MSTRTHGPDRVVVVTGAAGGIGRALALMCGARGDRVALLDLDGGALAQTAYDVGTAGGEALAIVCDVTDADACDAALCKVEDAWGRVDLLVNNAGISHRSHFAETSDAVLHKVMDVNFFGAVNCTRAALPALRRSGGAIAVLSSVAGFAPLVGRTAYAASKHALHGFFDSLRTELDGEVAVVLVCPSFVNTAIDRHAVNGDGVQIDRRRPAVGKMLEPEDVAAQLLDAVERRDRQRLVSPVAHLSLWVSRLAPALYDRIMLRSQSAEFG